jgi:sugar (pentulose or hexulose) kinase
MSAEIQAHLAVDLGASGGRVLAGLYDGSRLELRELLRFPNEPVKEADGWRWNLDALFRQIKDGIALAAKQFGNSLTSVGVDTWGVDYGLLDGKDRLLSAPFQYRDSRTQGMQELAFQRMPREEIYARTGIQFMFFNTLFQLLADTKAPGRMDKARRLLFMPDLVHFMLTGFSANEKSIASTSQLLNPHTQGWDFDLIHAMGLPERIFREMVSAGTTLG